MDVVIGGNVFRNTDGTVEVEGVPQIEFALRTPTGPLMVNFALFDEHGRMIAKVVDSSMMFNEAGAYDLSRSPTSVTMTHARSGKVILQAEVREANTVVVPEAAFTTAKGHLLEVTPVEWRIGKSREAHGDSDAKGGAVAIG